MERIKNYVDFCNEEISIKKALVGAAIGAGLSLGSPSARSQQKTPEKTGVMKDVEAMKKDVFKVKVSKDIPVGKLEDITKVEGNLYKAPKEFSDKDVIGKITKRKIETKNIVRSSGIDELIDKYDRSKSFTCRTYFLEGYDFPKDKMDEYKDLIFPHHTTKEVKDVWKWVEKNHSMNISFNRMDKQPMGGSNLDAKFDDGREVWTEKKAFSVANVFFLDKSDVKKCLAIVEGFKKKGYLTTGEMIAIFNFGFMDGSEDHDLRSLLSNLKYVCPDKSSNMWNLDLREVARRAKVGRETKTTKGGNFNVYIDYKGYNSSLSKFAELDYVALMENVERILNSLESKGVVQLKDSYGKDSSPILDMVGRIDDRFVPVGLKKDEVLTLVDLSRLDENTICKMSKPDGEIVWFVFKSNKYIDELSKIGEVTKEKDPVATGAVNEYAARMLDKYIKASEDRVVAFTNSHKGKTTVVAKIGKVKVIGATFRTVPLSDIRSAIEKELVDKLTGYDWRVKDTSDVTKKFENELKSLECVVLQKDNGEKVFSTISDFDNDDLGTGPLKFGKDLQTLIDGRVRIGMDKERIRFALGNPNDIDRTATKSGYEEIYIYRSSDFHKDGDRFYLSYSGGEATFLYFEGGVLTSIMDR